MASREGPQSSEPHKRVNNTSVPTVITEQPQSFKLNKRHTTTLDNEEVPKTDTVYTNRSNNQKKTYTSSLLCLILLSTVW